MPTDIRLDEVDGNWVVVESAIMKSTASDFMLDAPGRRSQAGGHRRALVHDTRDGLTINFNGDYPGGVTVAGDLTVAGRIQWESPSGTESLLEVVLKLKDQVAELRRFDDTRVDRLEQGLATLAELVGGAVVPPWRTQEEVENGDDMGVLFMSAEDLGIHVEYVIRQADPNYMHGEVISIRPPAGSVVRSSDTVFVEINLEG
jgi:hypothetical protein